MDKKFGEITRKALRFVKRKQNGARIRRVARAVEKPLRPGARPVLFFNASARIDALSQNAAFSLLASFGIRLQGTPVIHLVCNRGMALCVHGTNRENPSTPPPCDVCMRASRMIYAGSRVEYINPATDPRLENCIRDMNLDQLAAFTHEGLALGELALPSLRWILRRHHLVDDAATRQLMRSYILSAWNVAVEAGKVMDREKPQAVVVFNGMFFPEAAVKLEAKKRGIPVFTHEVALRPMTAFFTTGEATAYPISIPDSFQLNEEQNARLDDYLEKRFQGNFSMAGVRFWPEMKKLPESFWERVRPFKQIVPVFTNVIFDTSQTHANVVFEDMFVWLDEVLAVIRAHPETFFVVRAHPDEGRKGKESRESVAMWAEDRRIQDLPNVLFVTSAEFFSSYELIQHSKFVMVYNSTIGMEAALMGAAVLAGGKARFTQLPMAFFPQTIEEYRGCVEDFLSVEAVQVPVEFRLNARRFLYYQLYCTSLPFEQYMETGAQPGFVYLKDFEITALESQNSPAMKVILDGILSGGNFILEP